MDPDSTVSIGKKASSSSVPVDQRALAKRAQAPRLRRHRNSRPAWPDSSLARPGENGRCPGGTPAARVAGIGIPGALEEQRQAVSLASRTCRRRPRATGSKSGSRRRPGRVPADRCNGNAPCAARAPRHFHHRAAWSDTFGALENAASLVGERFASDAVQVQDRRMRGKA